MLFLILVTCLLGVTHAIPPCPMRPMLKEITASRTPGDGGYKILFSESNTEDESNEYTPRAIYTIRLQGSLDGLKQFKRFTLTMHSQNSAFFYMPVGRFQLRPEFFNTTIFNKRCIRTVSESTDSEKFDIQVNWRAPMQGTGCVIFSAMVLENNERWYAEDGALTKTVCEAKTEIVNAKKTRKLEVAENIEDESKRSSYVKLIQNQYITLPDDPVLAKVKVCMVKRSSGRCMGYYHFRRWAFNPQTLKCEPFWYGGCQGNQNNFLSEEVCDEACDIVRTTLIHQALNVTVNQDQTPIDSLSPSSPSSLSGLRGGIPLDKLDDV